MDKKILLIGFHSSDLITLKEGLAHYFEIDTAENSEDAVKYLMIQYRLVKLVLVCMDIFRKDNYDLTGQMKKNVILDSIPVICIGKDKEGEAAKFAEEEEAIENGAIDFFTAPFNINMICKRIKNLIRLRDNASFANIAIKRDVTRNYINDRTEGTFWNPKSLDTMILHTYVGAACIFELYDNCIMFFRVNKKFTSEVFGQELPMEKILGKDLSSYMDSENREILMKAFKKAENTEEESCCELIIRNIREDQPVMYLHLSMKLLDHVKSRRLFYCTLENNTEQIEAKHREQGIMEQLQIIIHNFAGGITATCEENGKVHYLYANDEFYSMFGYTKETFETELSGTVYNLILPEQLPIVRKAVRSSAAQKTIELDWQARKKDGTTIWIHSRNSVCHLEGLRKQVSITFYNDITLEHESENRIRTINERLGNSEIFFQLDITNHIVEEYRSKYEPEENVPYRGKNRKSYEEIMLSNIYKKDRENAEKVLSYKNLARHYVKGDTKISVEYRRHMPNGKIRWFAATAVLMKGLVNGTVNAFIYCHDINKKMKKRIAGDRILDTDVEDITLIDVEDGSSQVIRIHNGSVIDLGEADFRENLKQYVENEVAKEDRQRCQNLFSLEYISNCVKKSGKLDFSFWTIQEGGSNRRKNVHITYLDSTHEEFLMVGRDITELFEKEREQQEALRQAAELSEYANRSKSEFLSRMSHDMRTPLNAILGITELAKKEAKSPELEDYLKSIDISGHYLLSLINDNLDLSKIESGKMELRQEQYSLEEFVLGINTVIKPLMDARNIEFIMRLQDQVNNIVVDKMRFNQNFYNLLSNAAKYTPEGGRVEFSSEPLPEKDGKFGMRFSIRDNGIGMSREYQKVLFDPFTRENRTAHTEQKGTGLGLAIVKKILDLAGGTIHVISEPNQGTEFIVDMYAFDVKGAKKKPETAIPQYDDNKLKGLHILFADDTEINAQIFKKILEYKGCEVTLAKNGAEAVNLFETSEQGYYDVILTDLRMPIMDGFEEARRIRASERPDAKTVPIAAATADAYSDIMEKILAAGMNARMVKPIEPEVLCETVVRLVEKNK